MNEVLSYYLENWSLILLAICALILMIQRIIEFIGYPTEKKREEIKNVLLYYVTEAEKDLGGGTGAIKLSKVYQVFCEKFPYVVKWIPYDKFSELVDEVLPTMKRLLQNQMNLKEGEK